jgi:hypothetical protein
MSDYVMSGYLMSYWPLQFTDRRAKRDSIAAVQVIP